MKAVTADWVALEDEEDDDDSQEEVSDGDEGGEDFSEPEIFELY